MLFGLFFSMYFLDKSYHLIIAQISLINSIIYFIADLIMKEKQPKIIDIIHHGISAIGCFFGLISLSNLTIFTAKGCGFLELSNPCWTFLRLRLDRSNKIHLPLFYNKLVAGIVFMIVFLSLELLDYPYFYIMKLPQILHGHYFI